jgi:dipeptidyl aminopeptidase/acylaminoacyl peptidase
MLADPEATPTYKERSPINSVEKFSVPVALFQGLEDKVVPPNQAIEVYEQLSAKGVPTVCVLFEGEQ